MVPFGARFPYPLGPEEETKKWPWTGKAVMVSARLRTGLSAHIDLVKAPTSRRVIYLTFLKRVDNVRYYVWRALKLQAIMAQQPHGGASTPSTI
ncbi:hypothetical protein COCCADRAFT_35456 [Bipolaris zeicola 26-R-13]|uniref:Uncharacterized protein n=1 Tax=Cochliobolus carbonum (strain 26-R-13) TaxID=930089 RepID=W6YBP1_COCC2|nr:uncharacterized protein COCCADRAFT_35456 [Bipolaris zeicola 26-R-13]EUC35005.1 hypothetical protein COCCADRAFT_35456 [Bipolaris zeicola 26-R-13]